MAVALRFSRQMLLLSASATAGFRLNALPAARAALASTPPPSLFATRSVSSGIRASASLEDEIKSTVADNKVVVYSKSWCPFCQKTKALFDGLGVEYTAVELDQRDDGADVQEALLGMTEQRTVPNVFVGGKHLGGNDDTQKAAASGKLKELLGA